MSEVENEGWVTHPDCSPEREIGENTLFTLKKNKAI
jgi:hypothetical protein